MPLPTKDDFLAQLQPLDSIDACPICHHEIIMPFTTACKHTFCRECLAEWMCDHPSCPTCRRVLYETRSDESDSASNDSEDDDEAEEDLSEGSIIDDGDDDDESESSNDSDHPIDEATARKMAIDTGWIELSFEVDRDSVIDKLTKRIIRGLDRDYLVTEFEGDEDLVTVNSKALIEIALASLLYIKPRRDEYHCLHSTGHYIWEAIMEAVRAALISHEGETLDGFFFWMLLVETACEVAGGSGENGRFPASYSPVHENADGDQFQSDMYWFVDAIVEQARLEYAKSD